MINSILAKGLQCHKSKKIEFCGGINIIMGGNQAGKSALIRGTKWTLTNRPLGNWMINTDIGVCSFKLVSDKGFLKRIKGEGCNDYVVSIDGDVQEYSDVGLKIPEFISSFGFPIFDVKGEKIFPNIGLNIDEEGLFFIQHQARVRYGLFSVLTGCDIIDKIVKDFTTERRSINKNIDFEKDKINELGEELKQIPDISKLESRVERILGMVDEIDELQKISESLSDITVSLLESKNRLELINLDIDLDFENLFEKRTKFVSLEKGLRKNIENLEAAEDSINKFQYVSKKTFDEIEGLFKERCFLSEIYDLLIDIENNKNSIIEVEKEIASIEKQLSEFKVCPLCGK